MKRLAWLAIDGLDWDLTQALVDAGKMPFISELIAAGSSGPLAMPPPGVPAATWTSAATGVLADRHGVCHALAPRRDGLTIGPIGLESVRMPSVWMRAANAGLAVRIAGWPASLPSDGSAEAEPLPGNLHVAGLGFDVGARATPAHWPLSPELVWPLAQRPMVQDALVHPDEVGDDAVNTLRAGIVDTALRQAACEFIARIASVQALGMSWLSAGDAALIGMRFDGLSEWTRELHRCVGPRLPEVIAATYQWLDLIVGRWMHELGPETHLVLTTSGALPGRGYRSAIQRGPGTRAGLAIAGPGVPADELLGPASILDVCPTVLHLLGLLDDELAATMDGRSLLGAAQAPGSAPSTTETAALPPSCQAVEQDAQAMAWLAAAGIEAIDTAPMRALVEQVETESLRTWAWVRRCRGHLHEACEELLKLSRRQPAQPVTWLILAEALISAGRDADCASLLGGLPSNRDDRDLPVWEAVHALIDYARRDWPSLSSRLEGLMQKELPWVNPAAWYGWSLLLRGEALQALETFERAAERPQEPLRVWEGMGRALIALGRSAEAVRSFDRAIAEQPYSGALHRLRGDALDAAGAPDRAIAAWSRAWTLAPALPGLAEQLGRAVHRQHAIRDRQQQSA